MLLEFLIAFAYYFVLFELVLGGRHREDLTLDSAKRELYSANLAFW